MQKREWIRCIEQKVFWPKHSITKAICPFETSKIRSACKRTLQNRLCKMHETAQAAGRSRLFRCKHEHSAGLFPTRAHANTRRPKLALSRLSKTGSASAPASTHRRHRLRQPIQSCCPPDCRSAFTIALHRVRRMHAVDSPRQTAAFKPNCRSARTVPSTVSSEFIRRRACGSLQAHTCRRNLSSKKRTQPQEQDALRFLKT